MAELAKLKAKVLQSAVHWPEGVEMSTVVERLMNQGLALGMTNLSHSIFRPNDSSGWFIITVVGLVPASDGEKEFWEGMENASHAASQKAAA